MFHSPRVLAVAALLGAAVACQTGRHSPAGFRLPEGGDKERGKADFLGFRCDSCHEVAGVDLPAPTIQPAVPLVLGGTVEKALTDGYLVTSIINPSHRIAGYPRELMAPGGVSRMPNYGD